VELLAPAGNEEALKAAIQNGADAVYLGAQALNARMGAGNFDAEQFRRAADYLHERGRKMYVTVNTLVKQNELPALVELAGQIAEAGADAAIVQDMGVARSFREMLPSLPLHASTQMAIHSRQGARFAREAGFSRVVLARELSYGEIAECAREGPQIEVFAHGALCVSCSGQCLFSSMIGGRSGNRGQCAQPCRLPHKLAGAVEASGYLLSPRDLMALRDLPAFRAAGVASIKIEGRLKRAEYVAVVTAIYRRALDNPNAPIEESAVDALKQVFNRGGFTRGYGPGLIDRDLIAPERPNHEGIFIGVASGAGRIQVTKDISKEDQLILRRAGAEDSQVTSFDAHAGGIISLRGVLARDALYRLADESQLSAARESYRDEHSFVQLQASLTARAGETAVLTVTDGVRTASAESGILEQARKSADLARIEEQTKKTGGTPYEIVELQLSVAEDAFIPISVLNQLRRDALNRLGEMRITDHRGCDAQVRSLQEIPDREATVRDERRRLRVQSASPEILTLAAALGAEPVFAPDDLTDAGFARAVSQLAGLNFSLALPPVLSGDALDALNRWARRMEGSIPSTLISNPGQLALQWPEELHADYWLNIANRQALAFYRERGVAGYTPSIELTTGEINALDAQGEGRELLVYGAIPLMWLRHCPLRAHTPMEGAHAGCTFCDRAKPGSRLEDHSLIDRKDISFPLRRQAMPGGCVVSTLNSATLMPLRHVEKLPRAASWRMIFDRETPEQAKALIALFLSAMEKNLTRESLKWSAIEGMETTTGHYFRGVL